MIRRCVLLSLRKSTNLYSNLSTSSPNSNYLHYTLYHLGLIAAGLSTARTTYALGICRQRRRRHNTRMTRRLVIWPLFLLTIVAAVR
jgi:hypothetical protein